jgi:hypothetical protein
MQLLFLDFFPSNWFTEVSLGMVTQTTDFLYDTLVSRLENTRKIKISSTYEKEFGDNET